MPVIDHAIHASVQIGPDHRYGCHNRPHRFQSICHGADCYGMKVWPFVMSHDCRHDGSETDPSCAGCHHAGLGARYAESVRGGA